MARKMFSMLNLLIVVLIATESSHAFDFNTPPTKRTSSNGVRNVSFNGPYTLDAGESVQAVKLVYYISTSNVPGNVQGQFTTTPRNASVTYGDYQLTKFKLQFTVRRNGVNSVYSTQLYTY